MSRMQSLSRLDSLLHSHRERSNQVEQQLQELQVQVGVVCAGMQICLNDVKKDKENDGARGGSGDRDTCLILYKEQLDQLSHNLQRIETEGGQQQSLMNFAHSQTHSSRDIPLSDVRDQSSQQILHSVFEQNACQEKNCHLKEDIENSINRALRQISKQLFKSNEVKEDKKSIEKVKRSPFREKNNLR